MQSGLSLIELMIAMTLGLVLLAAVTSLFVQNNRSYRQNDQIATMQDSARFAIQTLSRDLMLAGYLGGMFSADGITASTTLNNIADCGPSSGNGWAFDIANAVEFTNDVDATGVNSIYSCLQQDDVSSGTDIVTIRRVAGQRTAYIEPPATTAVVNANQFYLQTNLSVGTLFHNNGSNPIPNPVEQPLSAPMEFWRYVVRLYYIHPNSDDGETDGIPTLCRREFVDSVVPPDMATGTCLAEGVENLQIQWGLDSTGNGVADTYTSNPGVALNAAINARIFLLMRSRNPDPMHIDDKSYTLAGNVIPAQNDNYYRRVYETTVLLRN